MGSQKATLSLGFGIVAAVLIACSVESQDDGAASQSTEAELAATGSSGKAATPIPSASAAKAAPNCNQDPVNGVPPKACIDKCLPELHKNPAFDCVTDVLGKIGPGGTPSKEQMAACGCTYVGHGDGTAIPGGRDIFSCGGGKPPFMVSPVPGTGTVGIVAGPELPGCLFDITEPKPGKPVVIYDPKPNNACLQSGCHTAKSPFIRFTPVAVAK